MEAALFFYNILILIAFAVCCVDFYFLYHKHRDKSQLYISIVFLLFIFDNLRLYMFEFLPGFKQIYILNITVYEFISNILAFWIIFSYRLTLIYLEKTWLKAREILLWMAIFAITIISSALSRDIAFGILDNIVLGITVVFVFTHSLNRYKKCGGFPKRAFVPQIRPSFLISSILFQLLIFTEGIISNIGIHIVNEQRQVSIELLSVFYSFLAIRFLHKRQIVTQKFEEITIVDVDKAVLSKFCQAYGLTQRENEILELLVQGNTNAEICKAAFISEGTVKTHSHNIYSKLNIKNRTQLGIKFREFQRIN